MLRSRSFLAGSGLLVAISAIACSSDSLTTPGTATLQITTFTSGTEPDPDGYTVQVDAGAAQTIGSSASIRSTDLSPGDHAVQLAGMAPNCSVTGDNPRTVSVVAGETATVSFAVTCSATSGGLQVTTSTSGPASDPDGYLVLVDGSDRGTIGASGAVNVGQLAPGDHQIGLSGIAANCQVGGNNPQTATIVAGTGATIAFTVTCSAPPANAGSLRVRTATTGGADPDGYSFAVDNGASQPIGANATAMLTNVAGGSHSVKLAGLTSNCAVQGANPRSVSVSASATAEVSFAINCSSALRWSEIPLPAQFHGTGLWASSAADIFVTGFEDGSIQTSILHYNGREWTKQYTGGNNSFGALWGTSPTEVFAVVGGHEVLRYGGADWADIGPHEDFWYYVSVWGTSGQDLFAGGFNIVGDDENSLIAHYDGTGWSFQPNPLTPSEYRPSARVHDFSGTSPTNVYALGMSVFGASEEPESTGHSSAVARYDGSSWNQIYETRQDVLNGVWANSSTDVFVVAASGSIIRYNGTSWSPMNSPTSKTLADIWGRSGSDAYAVGADGILHYDGVNWSIVRQTSGLRVWGTPTDVFVLSEDAVLRGR
jgi:hypothetical protein